ncbi:hypothetical protein [Stackebrandtia soli]|uniref:hypothetical protein n=1 Tax=Stackebrandtia soli TaxID=1892856 RepID=UPI0039EAEF22
MRRKTRRDNAIAAMLGDLESKVDRRTKAASVTCNSHLLRTLERLSNRLQDRPSVAGSP